MNLNYFPIILAATSKSSNFIDQLTKYWPIILGIVTTFATIFQVVAKPYFLWKESSYVGRRLLSIKDRSLGSLSDRISYLFLIGIEAVSLLTMSILIMDYSVWFIILSFILTAGAVTTEIADEKNNNKPIYLLADKSKGSDEDYPYKNWILLRRIDNIHFSISKSEKEDSIEKIITEEELFSYYLSMNKKRRGIKR